MMCFRQDYHRTSPRCDNSDNTDRDSISQQQPYNGNRSGPP